MSESETPKRAALGVVFLTVMIDLMGFGLMMPLIPLYARDYGAAPEYQGLLVASYSLMQLVFSPILGRLSDRFGRRPILLLGLLGSTIAYALFAAAKSLEMLFVARLLAGTFAATIPTAQAYVADVTTPETRARGMGMIGAAFGIGFVIGPAIGGPLSELHHNAPALFASGLSLLAFTFGLAKLKEPERRVERSREGLMRGISIAFQDRNRALLLVLFFGLIYAFANFESMFSTFGVEQHAFTRSRMSWLVALVGIFVALVQGGAIHRMVKKYGERPLFAFGAILFAAGFVVLATSESDNGFYLACALIGLGQGFSTPTLNALISKTTSPENQGAVFGVSQSFSSLARVVGHASAGMLYKHAAGAPFLISSGVLLVICGVFMKSAVGRGNTETRAE